MSTLAAQQSTFHGLSIKNDSRDENYQDIFEGFIRESPELNLINDLPSPDDDIDQKPLIHSAAFGHPHMQLPLLQHHRLHNPVHPPSLAILKPHVLQQPSTTPTSSGGISPTLTWSGDPSPIDDTNSPTLNDSADLDGEEWNPPSSSPTSQLFAAPAATVAAAAKTSSSRRNSAGSARGRESALDGDGPITRASSHSHSRSRSSKRSASSSTSADGGDELTMSNLSIQNGTTSLSALMSGPPSPQASVAGASAHTPKPSAPARKKTRTSSSSRSSISSIDALISEAMGSNNNNNNNAAGRLVPTGHRRNITSASLVPLDAPTQIRNYLTPSSTSKKEIPSAFVARRNKLKAKEAAVTKPPAPGPSTAGRKRTRDEAGGDEVDQLQDDDTPMSGGNNNAASPSTTPSSPTGGPVPAELASESSSLLSAIEAKRRQNTLAARRSRQRKLDYVRNLEELVSALTRERDSWKARAEGAEKILGYRPDEDEMDEA
ncbi:hypothetical protein FRC04_003393 [Tulasnella sp. 424]|nr:hypothetical protein FRC04_003393 [Tulasnella sp. 424]KAG8977206.1 hypothetical protein FRC05_002206 [Tulasnella sp. 425]